MRTSSTLLLTLVLLAACGGGEDTAPGAATSTQAGGGSGAAGKPGKAGAGAVGFGGAAGVAGQGGGGAGGQPSGGAAGASSASGASGVAGMGGGGAADSPFFARVLGDSASQFATAVSVAQDGSIWFGGYLSGTIQADGQSISALTSKEAFGFIGKSDRFGHVTALKKLGQGVPSIVDPYRFAPAGDGGCYALVRVLGAPDLGLGPITLPAGEVGVVVVRFDGGGNAMWQVLIETFDYPGKSQFSAIASVDGGGVVVSVPRSGAPLRRIGADGALLWQRDLPAPFTSMSISAAGDHVHVAGTAGAGDLGFGPFKPEGDLDGVVLTFEHASGTPVGGARTIGSGGGQVVLYAAAEAGDGSLLVGGAYRGTFTGLPTPPDGSWNQGPIWAKLPPVGPPLWVNSTAIAKVAPGAAVPESAGTIPEVLIDAEGGEHLVMVERGTFDVGFGAHTSTTFQNVGDIFLLDLGPGGGVVSQRFLASGVEDDIGRYEVQAVSDADGLVVAGSFRIAAGPLLGGSQPLDGKGQVYFARLPR